MKRQVTRGFLGLAGALVAVACGSSSVGPGGGGTSAGGGQSSGGVQQSSSGTSSSGSSGTSSSGSSGSSTSSTGDVCATTAPGPGYFTSGTWHGYAWSVALPPASTSTIDPLDFGAAKVPANGPFCVKGNVAATKDYGGSNMIGVNLNQSSGPKCAAGTIVPSATAKGITVDVKNNNGAQLRVQLQGPQGDTLASQRWCSPLIGTGGFIPWASFTTECWSAKAPGVAYNGTDPLAAIIIQAPGDNLKAIATDFCLNSIVEGEGGGNTCSPGSGTLDTQYGSAPVHQMDGTTCNNYIVQNNAWGMTTGKTWGGDGGSQTISYTGTNLTVVSQAISGSGVLSYPSTFIGANNNRSTTGSNLPIVVSAIKSVNTTFTWTPGSGEYNTSYDVWFDSGTPAGAAGTSPTGGFLMVWLHKPGQNPIGGSPEVSGISIPGASGTWNMYTGYNGSVPCTSYVAAGGDVTSITFDLNAFIKDALARKGPSGQSLLQSTWSLTNVFAGFEIWSGGAGLKSTAFSAVVK